MTPAAFFTAIWPQEGPYCLVIRAPQGMGHHWYDTIDAASEAAAIWDQRGRTVYHACATFIEKGSRKADNAKAVRSLWLDIDVGEGGAKYGSLAMAGAGLRAFIDTTSLPDPSVLVASGGGLHVYWCFEDAVAVDDWRGTATLIKRLSVHHGFRADPSRTADAASILRPVGTHNFKYDPPREVKALTLKERVDWGRFKATVGIAASVLPIDQSTPQVKKALVGFNSEFTIERDFDPSLADEVANHCAQVRWFRESKGNLPEPSWYAAIGVVAKCEDGHDKIHEWSSGYAGYTAKETDAKIAQVRVVGPTTCAHFASLHPGGCAGCPHSGHITSPIQLGVKLASAPLRPMEDVFGVEDDAPDETLNSGRYPIDGFGYTNGGMTFKGADKTITFYPYDLQVKELAYDEMLGHEVAVLRHWLPKEGWKEFAIRSAVVSSTEKCETALRDSHVKPLNSEAMRLYLKKSMEYVQKHKRMRKLYSSFGWKDGTDFFVLGDVAFHKDGRRVPVGISPTLQDVAKGIHSKGDAAKWIEATAVLGRPGMEAHALIWSVGAGAPLMKLTGFEGALINAVGRSSSGKTSMARFALSMYGNFDMLRLKQGDTQNAKIQRMGVLSSLPVYVDELTNEDPHQTSDFVYEITQGRSKLRLKIDGTERPVAMWNTIVLSSSNMPLSSKLGLAKANPEAERLRLFEVGVDVRPEFDYSTGRDLKHMLDENYGHVGEKYIAYIVEHQDKIKRELGIFIDQFRAVTRARDEERMWIASLSCCLYGVKILNDLGLCLIDPKWLTRWMVTMVKRNRLELDSAKYDPLALLGMYINECQSSRLTVMEVKAVAKSTPDYAVVRPPLTELHMRFDQTANMLWIERRHFREWLAKHYEDYRLVIEDLSRRKIVLRECSKTLGAGTNIATVVTPCFEVGMGHPDLGNTTVSLVQGDNVIKFASASPNKQFAT